MKTFKEWLQFNELTGIYPLFYAGLSAYPDLYFVNSSYKVYIDASLKAKTNPPKNINTFSETHSFMESYEIDPKYLGELFNRAEDWGDFVHYLRTQLKDDPALRFDIVAPWHSLQKTRAAKALIDMYRNRLNIDRFAIQATREQYNQDVNAFQSGLEWIEGL